MTGISTFELGLGNEEIKLNARTEVKRRMWTETDEFHWYGVLSTPVSLTESLAHNLGEAECSAIQVAETNQVKGIWA